MYNQSNRIDLVSQSPLTALRKKHLSGFFRTQKVNYFQKHSGWEFAHLASNAYMFY